MLDSMFGKSFNSAKCKTLLKLAMSRIKLLRNKRDIQGKQMRRDLAQLLQTNQDPSARIRVEHVFREQNIMAAYEIIELFCELIVVRLPIIESQRQCPIDLREAVSSLIFAAPRCADLPELQQIRNLFAAKYGKEFVAAAAELRPDCGVNRLIIEKLSVRAPSGEVKLKLMKEIAAEHNVDWDPTESEAELLKAPEDLLEGPNRFLGASQIPISGSVNDDSVSESRKNYDQDSNKIPSRTSQVEVLSSTSSLKKPSWEENNFQEEKQDSSRTPSQTSRTSSLKKPSREENHFQEEKQFIPFILPVPGDSRSQGGSLSSLPDVEARPGRGSYDPSLHVPPTFRQTNARFDNEELQDDDDDSGQFEHRHRLGRGGSSRSFVSSKDHTTQQASGREDYKDVAAAARAAAESAERAAAAARAAASLAGGESFRGGSSQKFAKNVEESSSESEDDFASKKVPRSQARPREDNIKAVTESVNERNAPERPLFDEYPEKGGSQRAERVMRKRHEFRKEFSSDEEQSDSSVEQSISPAKSRSRKYDDDFYEQQDSNLPQAGGRKKHTYSSSVSNVQKHEGSNLSTKNQELQNGDGLKAKVTTSRHSEFSMASGAAHSPVFDESPTNFYQKQQSNPETVVSHQSGSQPPHRPPPNLPGSGQTAGVRPEQNAPSKTPFVHPKLPPDYDDLAARFQALRSTR